MTKTFIDAEDQIATASISDAKLATPYIKADGTRAFTGAQSLGGFKITSLATPTAGTDAANKSYVDSVATGLNVKQSVRLTTTAALPAVTAAGSGVGKTMTANAVGVLTVDGVATVLNNRILVKDQSTSADNGIYTVTTAGTVSVAFVLTRSTDADQNAEVTAGLFTFVAEGTAYADTGWVLTTDDPITVDTTGLLFTQFSSAGVIVAGAGLTQTGNTINVIAGDTSITVNADELHVNPNTTGGLETSSGLRVKTFSGGAITVGASGIQAVVDNSTLEISSNALQIKDLGVTWAKLAAAVANRIGRYDRRESFSGDGSTTVFTLSQSDNDTATAGTLVYRGGVLMKPGAGNDYTISGNAITFLTAPASSINLEILYKRTGATQ